MHPIEKAYEEIPRSIILGSEEYPEGRNVLIKCLCRLANRTDYEVVSWLKVKGVKVKDLDDYKIKDD